MYLEYMHIHKRLEYVCLDLRNAVWAAAIGVYRCVLKFVLFMAFSVPVGQKKDLALLVIKW